MSRKSFGLGLTLFLFVNVAAFADQFYFTSAGSVTWDGVYVNPYQANDNTQPQNNPLTIYCDDWNTEFSGNPTWNADVYTLTAANVSNFKYGDITTAYNYDLSGSTLQYTQYSNPNTYDLYLEAAYLDTQLASVLTSSDTTAQKNLAQQEYSAANWLLFVNSSNVGSLVSAINNSGSTFSTDVYTDLSDAEAAIPAFTAAGWDVIVPVNNSFPMQEFLVQGFTGATVPEPSAFILLGTLIAGVAFMGMRRRRSRPHKLEA